MILRLKRFYVAVARSGGRAALQGRDKGFKDAGFSPGAKPSVDYIKYKSALIASWLPLALHDLVVRFKFIIRLWTALEAF